MSKQQTYQEFSTAIKNAGGRRNFKVSNSWGIYDAYKLIRRNKWYDIGRPLKEKEFYAIVRKVNQHLATQLALGHEVVFPSKMGKLELRKSKVGVSLLDGRLRITYPVDWDSTLRLWYEDAEEMKNKTLLRNENEYVYRIKYCKYEATYENKVFYEFTLNRFIRRALKENIKQGKTDTVW